MSHFSAAPSAPVGNAITALALGMNISSDSAKESQPFPAYTIVTVNVSATLSVKMDRETSSASNINVRSTRPFPKSVMPLLVPLAAVGAVTGADVVDAGVAGARVVPATIQVSNVSVLLARYT